MRISANRSEKDAGNGKQRENQEKKKIGDVWENWSGKDRQQVSEYQMYSGFDRDV